MVDVAVALPEPQPGDDEDVVWGLSTAAALWARGERDDAIVWLRRAAEAASTAGQEIRAGELQASAEGLERAASPRPAAMTPPPPPAARATAETLPQDLLEPAEDEPIEEDRILARALEPALPAPQPTSPVTPPHAPALPVPSTARTPTMAPPPPTSRAPSVTPPAPEVSPPPERGPLASYPAYAAARPRSAARTPILDPWADEPTLPSMRVGPALRAILLEGGEVMVQLRRNQPRFVEDDDGVVTSAAPIDTTLRRARPPTPPTRKWTTTGEQPPGYIAEASAVPSKSVVPSRPRPPTPSPPASDTGNPGPPVPSAPAVPSGSAFSSAPASSIPRPSTSTPPPSAFPAPRPSTAPPPRSASAPPVAAAAHVDPINGPTLPSTPSAINAVTWPATPSAIPRSRPMTIPPPAPRVPTSALPIRVPPPSLRPPPSSASVRPLVIPIIPRATATPTSVRPPSLSVMSRPVSVPAPAPRPELVLDEVEAFADLSAEMRQRLVSLARVEALSADEEVSAFGAALVIDGEAYVCATIVDARASQAARGALVPVRGTLVESVALRVVAGAGGARVAVWEAAALEEALRACPWVLEGLVARADELQAFAGATMGPLGELDDVVRGRLLARFAVRVAPPREVILDAGAPVPGLILVCVGSIELADGVVVRAGEVLFPGAALDGAKAPSLACASASGAVFLVADRALTAELVASSPLAALLPR